jgi:hypothetical protein
MDEQDVSFTEEQSDLSTMSDEELNAQLDQYTEQEALEMEQTQKGYTDEEIDAMLAKQAEEDMLEQQEIMEDMRVSDLVNEPEKIEPSSLKERVEEQLTREQTSDQIMALLESQQWTYAEAYKLMRAAELVCNEAYWKERKAEPVTTQTTIYYTGNPTKTSTYDDGYGVNTNYGTTGTSFSNGTGSFKGIAKEARKMSEEDQKKFDEINKKHQR